MPESSAELHLDLFGASPARLLLALILANPVSAFVPRWEWWDEFYWWHILVPMTWIAAPARRELVRGIRIAFFVTVTSLVLKETLAPTWLLNLYQSG